MPSPESPPLSLLHQPASDSPTVERSEASLRALIDLLRGAHAGEMAAAYAYRGHWHSVSDPDEQSTIHRIEDEEWQHRERVGEMLQALGAPPLLARERRAATIGRVLGFLCHWTGWLAPMYGAGRLESQNVLEYAVAAAHARACGHEELVEGLLTMAEVEWDHERYFRARVEAHWLGRHLPLWAPPPPRLSLRETPLLPPP